MKSAVLYGPRDIRIESLPRPEVRGHELLIKLSACGICGSDVRTYVKGPNGRYTSPVVLGHEFVGEMAEIGEEVRDFRIGERVTAVPIIPCGKCVQCLNGEENICNNVLEFGINFPGGFAEYIKIPSEVVLMGGVFRLPERIPIEENCLIEPLAVCLHGMNKAQPKPGDTIVIIGDGPIGLMHIQVARLFGPRQIIIIGHRKERLRIAQEMGATQVIDSVRDNPEDIVKGLTNGQGANVVMLAMGNIYGIEQGLNMVCKGGRVVFFGGCPVGSEIKLDPNLIHYSEMRLLGSINCTIDEFRKAIELFEQVKYQPLIIHRFPLDKIVEGLKIAEDRIGLKVIVTMGEN